MVPNCTLFMVGVPVKMDFKTIVGRGVTGFDDTVGLTLSSEGLTEGIAEGSWVGVLSSKTDGILVGGVESAAVGSEENRFVGCSDGESTLMRAVGLHEG